MSSTMDLPKDELVQSALNKINESFSIPERSDKEKLALTCRILFDGGHDSGLAGQITARGNEPSTYYTQQLGLGFDEITRSEEHTSELQSRGHLVCRLLLV